MNNKERLRIHKLHYASVIEKTKDDKDLTNLIEWLISDLESYVKREEELFEVENHILWIDYRDYKFKIYLNAEGHTLVGDVLLNGEIDVIGLDSDSITHLITEMERAVDNQRNYRYQSELAKEIIEKNIRIKELEQKLHSHLPKVIASVYWWTKEPEDEFIDEEDITEKLDEELLESLGLRYGSNKLTTINQIDYVSELIKSTIYVEEYDYFFEYHGNF
jgi:hypothetical protein